MREQKGNLQLWSLFLYTEEEEGLSEEAANDGNLTSAQELFSASLWLPSSASE